MCWNEGASAHGVASGTLSQECCEDVGSDQGERKGSGTWESGGTVRGLLTRKPRSKELETTQVSTGWQGEHSATFSGNGKRGVSDLEGGGRDVRRVVK